MSGSKLGHHAGGNTFRKRGPARSRRLEVQFCKSIVESNGILPLLNKIFNEPGANLWVNGIQKISYLMSRRFDILRSEDLCRQKMGLWLASRELL